MSSQECTTENCGRLTTLFLCTACIVELDGLLEDVPALIPLLAGARAGTAVVRKAGSGGGGGVTGSKPPGSLDAMMLQAWLAQLPERAYTLASDNPEAGRWLHMARIWVPQARSLVWGPEDMRVYGNCETGECMTQLKADRHAESVTCQTCGTVHHVRDLIDRLKEKARGNPMPPREAREFLQKEARVFILKKDFENWVQLGKLPYVLERVTTTEKPRKIYYPGDVLSIFHEMRERRRVSA